MNGFYWKMPRLQLDYFNLKPFFSFRPKLVQPGPENRTLCYGLDYQMSRVGFYGKDQSEAQKTGPDWPIYYPLRTFFWATPLPEMISPSKKRAISLPEVILPSFLQKTKSQNSVSLQSLPSIDEGDFNRKLSVYCHGKELNNVIKFSFLSAPTKIELIARSNEKKNSAAPPGIEAKVLRILVARSDHWATKPQRELRVNFRLSPSCWLKFFFHYEVTRIAWVWPTITRCIYIRLIVNSLLSRLSVLLPLSELKEKRIWLGMIMTRASLRLNGCKSSELSLVAACL